MRRHIYETRLVPLGKPVSIPVVGDGTSRLMTLTFNDKSFELERTARTKPEVWVNHDRALRIGQVAMLYTSREFWCCDWLPDRDIPDDIEFEVGQPISVGLSQRKIGSGEPYLRGISIVRHGAIEGAKIVRRSEIKPAPVKPTTSPAAGRTTSDLASSPASTYYAPVLTRSKRTWTTWRSSTAASTGSSGQDAQRTTSSSSRTCKTSSTAVASSANTHPLQRGGSSPCGDDIGYLREMLRGNRARRVRVRALLGLRTSEERGPTAYLTRHRGGRRRVGPPGHHRFVSHVAAASVRARRDHASNKVSHAGVFCSGHRSVTGLETLKESLRAHGHAVPRDRRHSTCYRKVKVAIRRVRTSRSP